MLVKPKFIEVSSLQNVLGVINVSESNEENDTQE